MNDLTPYVAQPAVSSATEVPNPVPGAFIDPQENSNLREYWRIFRKHKGIIAASFFGAVAVAALIAFASTPMYTARTTVLIERKEPQVVDVKNVISESDESDDQDYYKTQYELLKSRSLAAQIIREQKLETNPVFDGAGPDSLLSRAQRWPAQALGWVSSLIAKPTAIKRQEPLGIDPKIVDAYQGMLDVEPVQRTRLVKIAFRSPAPEFSARIANAHAEAFIRQGLDLRTRANQEAQRFLEGKLGELKKRVEESEEALNRYRRDNGIISLDDKENIVLDRLGDLNKRLTEAEAERIALEAHLRLIRSRDFDSLPAVIGSTLISTLKTQLTQLQGEYANLSVQFKSGYPKLAQVKANLEEVQFRLQQEIKKIVAGIESNYLAAVGKERELRAKMEQQKAAILQLKDASVGYAVLARDADANRQLYNSVLERMKEVGVAAELRASNVFVIDRAEPPGIPSSPKKKKIISLAALLGLFGGLGLALLLEHLDDTLKNSEDAERYLALPSLGLVPVFPRAARSALALPIGRFAGWRRTDSHTANEMAFYPHPPEEKPTVSFDAPGVVNEAYRTLRAGILLAQAEQPPKTILFTSAVHGEGKTSTAVNSAISFARTGARVLLIDADLRRPACHKILGMRRGLGIAELLNNQIQPNWAIQPTHVDNLFFVSSGSSSVDPTEFVGSVKMREILSAVQRPYDYVLIDTPPVMAVSDALLLSTMVDGVVVVIGGHGTSREIVKQACARLRYAQARILGTMLNRVDPRANGYAEYSYEPIAETEAQRA